MVQASDRFGSFLAHVAADPTGALRTAAGGGVDEEAAMVTATLAIATPRGLLLDLLATGDHDLVEAAATAYIATLERPDAGAGRPEGWGFACDAA